MFRQRLAATLIPLLVSGAAFASPPSSGRPDAPDKAARVSQEFSVLHAVFQYAINTSQMADSKAKSDLVKGYAGTMATTNADADAKLMRLAEKRGIDIAPLDAQTEAGKSLLDRIKAETTLLESLDGDAWDKEFMTLVTNTQQSVLHSLEASKAAAKDPETKQFFGAMTTSIQSRLKTAQDVLAKVYGNQV